MACVKVNEYDNFESAYKAFKNKCVKENILYEIRKRSFYMTRGQRKRMKKLAQERAAWIRKQKQLKYDSVSR